MSCFIKEQVYLDLEVKIFKILRIKSIKTLISQTI